MTHAFDVDASLLGAALLLSMLWSVTTFWLLSQTRHFTRLTLTERLLPYSRSAQRNQPSHSYVSTSSLSDIGRWFSLATQRIMRSLGITSRLEVRLRLAGRTESAQDVQLRQILLSLAVFGGTTLSLGASGISTPAALVFGLGAGALAYLLYEQQLSNQVTRRREQLRLELPIVAEHLATLLGAGYSLGSSISHCSTRIRGVAGESLRELRDRTRAGVPLNDALADWADRDDLGSLRRFLGVLSLDHDTPDLATLVRNQAVEIRQEAHRQRNALLDKRSQQVWIPITVATLVPGVIFLLIPFLHAINLVTGT